jgi:DNA-binding GntR family transcriptional regulator
MSEQARDAGELESAKWFLVRQQIDELAAGMDPGERLPPERVLAERWSVSRVTVRFAISSLVREGRLRAEQGRGTFVQPAPIALRVKLGSFAAEVDRAHLSPATVTLDRCRDAEPPDRVRQHLGLAKGRAAVRIERLRLGDGVPLALECAWYPARLGGPLLKGDPPASLYSWLESIGSLPDAGEESVAAGLPRPDEARKLEIDDSMPIIRLTRRSYASGRPVEYGTAVLPANRYELWFPLHE